MDKTEIWIKIIFQGTGIGLKAEELEPIFDQPNRADISRECSVEGTSLGLSMRRMIIQSYAEK